MKKIFLAPQASILNIQAQDYILTVSGPSLISPSVNGFATSGSTQDTGGNGNVLSRHSGDPISPDALDN